MEKNRPCKGKIFVPQLALLQTGTSPNWHFLQFFCAIENLSLPTAGTPSKSPWLTERLQLGIKMLAYNQMDAIKRNPISSTADEEVDERFKNYSISRLDFKVTIERFNLKLIKFTLVNQMTILNNMSFYFSERKEVGEAIWHRS